MQTGLKSFEKNVLSGELLLVEVNGGHMRRMFYFTWVYVAVMLRVLCELLTWDMFD